MRDPGKSGARTPSDRFVLFHSHRSLLLSSSLPRSIRFLSGLKALPLVTRDTRTTIEPSDAPRLTQVSRLLLLFSTAAQAHTPLLPMTSAAIAAAAYARTTAQVTDWLDAEELVDIAAEVDDTLAAPKPEAVPLADEDEFRAAHYRAFDDPFIGSKVATRRLENAARQEEQRQDPAYRQRAAEAFAAMEARRTAALAEADAKHNIETKILMTRYAGTVDGLCHAGPMTC